MGRDVQPRRGRPDDLVQRLRDPLCPSHEDQLPRDLLLILQHVPDPLLQLDLELVVGLGLDVFLGFECVALLLHLERSKGDCRRKEVNVEVDSPASG